MQNSKKYLITGGTGFVGTPFIKEITSKLPGEYYCISRKKIESYNINWIELDLLDSDRLKCAISEIKPDVLIHLAWYVNPIDYLHSDENNHFLIASQKLFKCFLENGGKQIIATGTCFEYDLDFGYLQPNFTPVKQNNLYAWCKIRLYDSLLDLQSQYNFDFSWCRLFYMFGEKEYEQRLVPNIINKLLKNETPICSEGLQLRDYLYVKDVAKILTQIVKENKKGIINISSGFPITIRELGERIECILNKKNEIQFGGFIPKFKEPHLIMGTPIQQVLTSIELTNIDRALEQTIKWWVKRE